MQEAGVREEADTRCTSENVTIGTARIRTDRLVGWRNTLVQEEWISIEGRNVCSRSWGSKDSFCDISSLCHSAIGVGSGDSSFS